MGFEDEARGLGSSLFMAVYPGNKKEICDYVHSRYGIDASYWKTYDKLWEGLVYWYGVDLLARMALQELRKQMPEQACTSLRRAFEQRRTVSWDEYTDLESRYGRKETWGIVPPHFLVTLLDADHADYSVKWRDLASFFFKYADAIGLVTREDFATALAKKRKEELGIARVEVEAERVEAPVLGVEKAPIKEAEVIAEPLGLGDLEIVYEEFLKRQDYVTQRHPLIAAAGGEIDILGVKGEEAILVECKNWAEQTGRVNADAIRIFHNKAEEAKEDRALKGRRVTERYVSTSGFTDDARTLALRYGIDLVEGLRLAKELLEYGIIGLTVEGTSFLVVAPRSTKEAARYNRVTKDIQVG